MPVNPPVSLPQARALAKGVRCTRCMDWMEGREGCPTCKGTGVEVFPQDVWPQFVYDGDSGRLMFVHKESDWVPPMYAATDTVTAILWVLGTEAWRAKYGEWRLLIGPDSCSVVTVEDQGAPETDTLPDLLDAMLKEVA